MNTGLTCTRAALIALTTVSIGCSKEGPEAEDTSGASGQPSKQAFNGDPAPGGAGYTGVGGRSAPSIALAATDVVTVTRQTLEEGVAVTGDLRPIETVEVRARVDGEIVGVYAREGDRVRQGQVLARFEASEQQSGRQSAEADRASAQNEAETAKWNLDQSQELFEAGAVAERDLRSAQQVLAAARARLAAAEARVRSTSSLVQDTRVLAPTTGTVAQRSVENGEHVARNTVLFTVVRNDILELAASVPSRHAGTISAGQTVHFTADNRSFDGRVARVSPVVDPATRGVTVFLQIPNPNSELKGGTFATGRIISRILSGVIAIPTSAIRQSQGGEQPFVYRIDGSTLDIAPVRLGVADESSGIVQVVEGLSEGDRVVVGNVGALGRGMQVEVLGGPDAGTARTRSP